MNVFTHRYVRVLVAMGALAVVFIFLDLVSVRSLSQMSLLFGQAVRGLSAGTRVFEVRTMTFTMRTCDLCTDDMTFAQRTHPLQRGHDLCAEDLSFAQKFTIFALRR